MNESPFISQSMVTRFLSSIDTSGGWLECHPWTAARGGGDYGRFRVGGKVMTASRLAYEYFNGTPIPDGLQVRHSCDNPSCVNPRHLSLGTHAENQQDKAERHRTRRGVLNGKHADIAAEYVAGDSMTVLAKRYGVTHRAIWTSLHRSGVQPRKVGSGK